CPTGFVLPKCASLRNRQMNSKPAVSTLRPASAKVILSAGFLGCGQAGVLSGHTPEDRLIAVLVAPSHGCEEAIAQNTGDGHGHALRFSGLEYQPDVLQSQWQCEAHGLVLPLHDQTPVGFVHRRVEERAG